MSSDLPDVSIPLRGSFYLLINNSVSKQVPEKGCKHILKWEVTAMCPGCIGSRLHSSLHLSAAQAVSDYFSGTHFTCVWLFPKSYLHENIECDFWITQSLVSPFSWISSHLALPKTCLPTQKSRVLVFWVILRKFSFCFVLDNSYHCWAVCAHFKSYCLLPRFIRWKENVDCQNRFIY